LLSRSVVVLVLAVLVLLMLVALSMVIVVVFRGSVVLVLDMLDAHDTRWRRRSLYPATHRRKDEAQERQGAGSRQH
jgi:hypothetical protein